MKKELSKSAQNIIDQFLNLEIASTKISCPYFNNRRQKVRGGLKAQIGKAPPSELKKEVKIKAKKQNLDLKEFGEAKLKKFMIENNLGIDCSAFAYYVLNSQYKDENNNELKYKLDFSSKSLFRRIISNFRPIINTNVKLLADTNNSHKVQLKNAKPGDLIVFKKYGSRNDKDHVAITHSIDYDENPEKLRCIHSFQWNSDGKYGGGVRNFQIYINNPEKRLLEQTWIEKNKKNKNNETYRAAKSAQELILKRLKFL